MSARIAPEPISIGVSLNTDIKPAVNAASRPIEATAASTPDPHQNSRRQFSDGDKARPGDRPPGKDPSVLPQSLFDAALISSEYKPVTKVEPEPIEPGETTKPETDSAPQIKVASATSVESGTASQNVPEPTAQVLMDDAITSGTDSAAQLSDVSITTNS